MFRDFTGLFGRLRGKRRLVELALNNMTQGVVMFDATGRLIVCNERYLELYDLPPDIVKPGAKLIDVVRLRARIGSLPSDPQTYCTDLLRDMSAGKELNFVSGNCRTAAPSPSSTAQVPAASIGSARTMTSPRGGWRNGSRRS